MAKVPSEPTWMFDLPEPLSNPRGFHLHQHQGRQRQRGLGNAPDAVANENAEISNVQK
jgi:hypothetical protein